MVFHEYHPLIGVLQPSSPKWVPSSIIGKGKEKKTYSEVTRSDLPYRFSY